MTKSQVFWSLKVGCLYLKIDLKEREDAMHDLQTSVLIIEWTEVSNADVSAAPKSLLGSTAHSRRFWTRRFQTDIGHHLQWILIQSLILYNVVTTSAL